LFDLSFLFGKWFMTNVKICGITNLEDALVATKLGADALGFNFYERSPRYISPEQAGEINNVLPKKILKVGVFVNESVENIVRIAEIAQLDAAQLHGDETPEFVDRLKRLLNIQIIKALQVTPNFQANAVLDTRYDAILLDAYSSNARGGTGESFDWEVAVAISHSVEKLYLAGGLNPDNVQRAAAVVRPYTVDVASGVESSPGKKDPKKLRAFIANAKNA